MGGAIPGRCRRRSTDELGERDAERVSDEQQINKRGHALRGLVPVDRLVVPADELAEPDLGQLGIEAGGADAFPDLSAVGLDSVGHGVEWHPIKL